MKNIHSHIRELILKVTHAEHVSEHEVIQHLWSGYGEIVRYRLTGGTTDSVIVKHVKLPGQSSQRRTSHTDISHQRKIRSYQIETTWYSNWSKRCDDACRVPACLLCETVGDQVVILLEDLDAAGFSARHSVVNTRQIHACLNWLANFHATFMTEKPKGLWPIGTYWHLATRPDELEALNDLPLKNAAAAIDHKLSATPYKTIVHGDAKPANFCFAPDSSRVAAVDFQYVGGGCGIKDVAYLIDSCLNGEECQHQEQALLGVYFQALKQALKSKQKPVDPEAVEQNWRELYPVAWTDFHRFLKGWSPAHWDYNCYSERLARQVVAELSNTSKS